MRFPALNRRAAWLYSNLAIRDMNRVIASGSREGVDLDAAILAQQAALALLARSVSFGNVRLAVIRLSLAENTGADIPEKHWIYWREANAQSSDERDRVLFAKAARSAKRRRGTNASEQQLRVLALTWNAARHPYYSGG
jgi:hypothetical protein